MSKLEKLTPKQERLLTEVRDEYLSLIFDNQTKLNKKEAERGINWIYELSGLEKPVYIFWLSSPLGVQIAANMLLNGQKDQVWDQVWSQVRDQVWSQVWDQVWSQVRDQVWDQVRDQVWSQVRDQVWSQVRSQVGSQVRDQVRSQVRDQVRSQVRDQVRDQVWSQVRDQVGSQVGSQVWDQVWSQVGSQVGSQVWDQVWSQVRDQEKLTYYDFTPYGSIYDYGWVAFYNYFQRIGIKNLQQIDNMKSLLRSGIYDMVLIKNICFVSELPKSISREERKRLHCEDGPAIEWNDGFKLWLWKGSSVPQKLIETPESITKEDLRDNQNAEQRRCFIEKLGVSKYFEILSDGNGLNIIDEDTDHQGNKMSLMDFDFEREKIQVLEVICPSTDRVYNIYPPSQKCRSVWNAKADTFNSEKLMYRHGDVGLANVSEQPDKPLIET